MHTISMFRWLQRDAKLTIQEIDKAMNGRLDVNKIIKLHLEVGKMIGRIEERVKDLKKKPKPIYSELLSELEKRHHRLCNILVLESSKKVQEQKSNLSIRCPYQYIVEPENKIVVSNKK